MEEAQLELQNALTTTFLANLAFLSEYDNELYHRVDELSRMIENGTYKERYALEFNMQDGDFDIYDIVNDKYLYNKSPKRFNNDLIRKVDFDEKSSILNVAKHFLYEFQEEVDRKDRFEFEDSELLSAMTFNDTWEYSKITNDFLTNRKRRLKDIKKFIFMGTLLGRHIPRIARKIDAKIYLVLERNLEIFRLSLFTVDYTILAENDGVIFSIMDDTNNLEKKIMRFLNIGNLENYIIFMDEPENHLHPSAVIDLLDTIKEHNPNGQIWIATHSIPLLSHFDSSFLWFVENNTVKYSGKKPELVLRSLLGDEDRIQKLRDFTSLPSELARNRFTFECLCPPQVVKSLNF
jgi:hypothetical protein